MRTSVHSSVSAHFERETSSRTSKRLRSTVNILEGVRNENQIESKK
jgi:hypothetical protein